MWPGIAEEFFPPPFESLPSTVQDDPQTNHVAQKHSHLTTPVPKPPLQIPALLRTRREAGSCDPRQTTSCPIGKSALCASHEAERALSFVLLNLCQPAFSEAIAQSRTPRQIPALCKLVSPAASHPASSCGCLSYRDARSPS